MRVVVRGGFAAHLRRFGVLGVGGQAEFAHHIQNPPLHGLEPIAHIGQRAGDNHAHRVVEVGAFHLLLDGNLQHLASNRAAHHKQLYPTSGAVKDVGVFTSAVGGSGRYARTPRRHLPQPQTPLAARSGSERGRPP
jgi:hypothetical protein